MFKAGFLISLVGVVGFFIVTLINQASTSWMTPVTFIEQEFVTELAYPDVYFCPPLPHTGAPAAPRQSHVCVPLRRRPGWTVCPEVQLRPENRRRRRQERPGRTDVHYSFSGGRRGTYGDEEELDVRRKFRAHGREFHLAFRGGRCGQNLCRKMRRQMASGCAPQSAPPNAPNPFFDTTSRAQSILCGLLPLGTAGPIKWNPELLAAAAEDPCPYETPPTASRTSSMTTKIFFGGKDEAWCKRTNEGVSPFGQDGQGVAGRAMTGADYKDSENWVSADDSTDVQTLADLLPTTKVGTKEYKHQCVKYAAKKGAKQKHSDPEVATPFCWRFFVPTPTSQLTHVAPVASLSRSTSRFV